MSDGKDAAVRVALRCRPLLSKELAERCHECVEVINGEQVLLANGRAFTFDHVFGSKSTQEDFFQVVVKPVLESFFQGYNQTLFAYGQTGSGKTYTMGSGNYEGLKDKDLGVIPRTIREMFLFRDACSASRQVKYQVSFLELYNEDIRDMLDPHSVMKGQTLPVREDPSKGVHVDGLSLVEVSSADEMLELLKNGSVCRTTGSTLMNLESSRSHAVFTVTASFVEDRGSESVRATSKFNFVDLAGSERLKRTGAVGMRRKEGININSGLFALGKVISALADPKRRKGHVPYRDSKLTRLLQESLGGNSRTVMVACVSPADVNFEETLSTLKYADQAKNIRNKPVLNMDPTQRELLLLRKQVEALSMALKTNAPDFDFSVLSVDVFSAPVPQTSLEPSLAAGSEAVDRLQHEIEALKRRCDKYAAENERLAEENEVLRERNTGLTTRAAVLRAKKEYAEHRLRAATGEELDSNCDKSERQTSFSDSDVGSNLQDETQTPEYDSRGIGKVGGGEQGTKSVIVKQANEIEVLRSRLGDVEAREARLKRKLSEMRDTVFKTGYSPANKKRRAPSDSPLRAMSSESECTRDTTEGVIEQASPGLARTRKRLGDETDDAESAADGYEDGDGSDEDLLHSEGSCISSDDEGLGEHELRALKKSYEDEVQELESGIRCKERLVADLTKNNDKLQAMKSEYEERLKAITAEIRSLEADRTRMKKALASVDERQKETRKKMATRISELQEKLAQATKQKKEYTRLIQMKQRGDETLQRLKNELLDLKKKRVDLLRRQREEFKRFQSMLSAKNRDIVQLQKDNRRKDRTVGELKSKNAKQAVLLQRRLEEALAAQRKAKEASSRLLRQRPDRSSRPHASPRPATAPATTNEIRTGNLPSARSVLTIANAGTHEGGAKGRENGSTPDMERVRKATRMRLFHSPPSAAAGSLSTPSKKPSAGREWMRFVVRHHERRTEATDRLIKEIKLRERMVEELSFLSSKKADLVAQLGTASETSSVSMKEGTVEGEPAEGCNSESLAEELSEIDSRVDTLETGREFQDKKIMDAQRKLVELDLETESPQKDAVGESFGSDVFGMLRKFNKEELQETIRACLDLALGLKDRLRQKKTRGQQFHERMQELEAKCRELEVSKENYAKELISIQQEHESRIGFVFEHLNSDFAPNKEAIAELRNAHVAFLEEKADRSAKENKQLRSQLNSAVLRATEAEKLVESLTDRTTELSRQVEVMSSLKRLSDLGMSPSLHDSKSKNAYKNRHRRQSDMWTDKLDSGLSSRAGLSGPLASSGIPSTVSPTRQTSSRPHSRSASRASTPVPEDETVLSPLASERAWDGRAKSDLDSVVGTGETSPMSVTDPSSLPKKCSEGVEAGLPSIRSGHETQEIPIEDPQDDQIPLAVNPYLLEGSPDAAGDCKQVEVAERPHTARESFSSLEKCTDRPSSAPERDREREGLVAETHPLEPQPKRDKSSGDVFARLQRDASKKVSTRRPKYDEKSREKDTLRSAFKASGAQPKERPVKRLRTALSVGGREANVQTVETVAAHDGHVLDIEVMPEKNACITASQDSLLKIWDLETFQCKGTLSGHTGFVRSVTVSPYSLIFSAGEREVRVWSQETLKCLHSLPMPSPVQTLLWDDSRLFVGLDNNLVKVWDLASFAEIKTLSRHTGSIFGLEVSESLLLSSSRDHSIVAWDRDTLDYCMTFQPPHYDGVNALYCINGMNRLFSGSRDASIKVWTFAHRPSPIVHQAYHIRDAHKDWINSFAGYEDLVCSACREGVINVWNGTTAQNLGYLRPHDGGINSLATVPNHHLLLSASNDRTLGVHKITYEQACESPVSSSPVVPSRLSGGSGRGCDAIGGAIHDDNDDRQDQPVPDRWSPVSAHGRDSPEQ
eukprot:Rmarinus@m.10842